MLLGGAEFRGSHRQDLPMADSFALFVRPVRGHAVPRYGTRELLGAVRSPRSADVVIWDEDTVVPITHEYYRAFRKEMGRHLRKRELVQCSREDWEKQTRARAVAAAKAQQAEQKATAATREVES